MNQLCKKVTDIEYSAKKGGREREGREGGGEEREREIEIGEID